jgi:hypothetical protein
MAHAAAVAPSGASGGTLYAVAPALLDDDDYEYRPIELYFLNLLEFCALFQRKKLAEIEQGIFEGVCVEDEGDAMAAAGALAAELDEGAGWTKGGDDGLLSCTSRMGVSRWCSSTTTTSTGRSSSTSSTSSSSVRCSSARS